MSLSDIIIPWAKLASGKDIDKGNVFLKFISIWIAFNGIYDALYDEDWEIGRIEKFSYKPEMFARHKKLLGSEEKYKSAVTTLAEKGIKNIKNPDEEPFKINHNNDLRRVLRCVYQVRCNLFHSGKDIKDPRDEKVVNASFIIISRLIEPLLDPAIINSWDKTAQSAYDDPPALPDEKI